MKYNKVICVTTAYCRWETFECQESMLHGRFTPNLLNERWCILAHYPQKDNINQIKRICEKYKIQVFDSEYNRGHVGNLNNFILKTNQPKRTFMIKIDPDLMPPYWFDKPMLSVAESKKSIAVVGLWNSALPPIEDADYLCKLANYPVARWDKCNLGAVYGIDVDFLKEIDGFKESYKNWGGTEGNLFKDVVERNREWWYIMNVREEYPLELVLTLEKPYQMWKHYLSAQFYNQSYEDFLKEGCPKKLNNSYIKKESVVEL